MPFRLYADDPYWVPPLRIAEREQLNPAKNPFFEHAAMELYLARRDGRVVGRVAVIDDELHNEVHGDNLAFFGYFEAADRDVAIALLDHASLRARERGRDRLRGPASPSLNGIAGLQLDGFDHAPFVMTAYNRPEYPSWVEAAGFTKAKDLYSWNIDISRGVAPRAQKIVARAQRALDPAPTLRPIDRGRFYEDAELIRQIFISAWEGNWGFVPPTVNEFRHTAKEMKPVIDLDLALILEIEGRPVGFSLTLPDLNQVFKHMHGRLLPFGLFKLLLRRRYIDQARMLLLGVLPEFRRKGLELVLIAQSIENSQTHGYHWGECSWTLEDNERVNKAIRLVGAEHTKTYRVYDRRLDAGGAVS